MLLVLVLALTTLVAAACGGGGSRHVSSGAACAALIEFQGREYLGEAMHGAAPDLAGSAGTAVVPGCNDVQPATTTESSTSVVVYELAGIPAERALAVEDQTDVVYVARGICRDESTPSGLVACLRRDA
jgi:Family of unknown function (DUF6281)